MKRKAIDSTNDINRRDFVQRAAMTAAALAVMVQPGQSAVFVLARVSDPQLVAQQFTGYGGTVLRTTLPPDAAAKFQKLMAPHSASANSAT